MSVKDDGGSAVRKLKLWFFRDLSDKQRNDLFGLFGIPPIPTHGSQRLVFNEVLRLAARTGEKE